MSAHSTPITAGAMDATHSSSLMVSSSTTSPVTYTSMLPSPPREAASPSSTSPIAPVVLTTAMKEEDVSDTSRNTSQGFPKAGKPKNSFKAYVFDDPEHVDDCSNCGLSHEWNREGEDVKAKKNLGRSTSTETDRTPLDRTCNVSSPPIKIEITIKIEVEDSHEERIEDKKPKKKKASGNQERECYNCHKIGHIKRQCPGRLDGKSQNNRGVNRNKNRNKKSTKGNPQDRITRIRVVSNPGDYDYEGEADSDWYQGRD